MDRLLEQMTDLVGPNAVLAVLVFLSAVLLVYAVGLAFTPDRLERRLTRSTDTRGRQGRQASLRHGRGEAGLLGKVASFGEIAGDEDDRKKSGLRRRLLRAGYRGRNAPGLYYAGRVLFALSLPLLAVAVVPLMKIGVLAQNLPLVGLVAALAGLYLPSFWLSHRIQKRREVIRDDFPDALDQLLVCVEAGLSLPAALKRVGEELRSASPILSEELQIVSLEMRAGKTHEQAMRNLADRIAVDEVKSLSSLLIQSAALGTSVGQALRVFADDMRRKRLLRAEEKINKIPVKMVVPLVCFILPCLVMVILAPSIVSIYRNLFGLTTG